VTNATTAGNAALNSNAVSIASSTVTGRFINNGTILNNDTFFLAFGVWASDVQGGIINNGLISSPGYAFGLGASVDSVLIGATQTGAIDNFGTIVGGNIGFSGIAGTFTNRLWNHQGAVISGGNFRSGLAVSSTMAPSWAPTASTWVSSIL
jgi:hypothetical protein